jgi:archaemetzincin
MMKNIFFLLLISIIACQSNSTENNKNTLKELALIDKLKPIDTPLKTPKRGDWLFEHKETGQTFEQYKNASPVAPNDTQNCLFIQPIGDFTEGDKAIINYTTEYISLFFNLKTILLNPINDNTIPTKNKRINSGIEQINTKYILDSLLNKTPKNALATMAITAKDLYPSEDWNYVFGEAYTHKRKAVSSIFRYKNTIENGENDAIYLERLIKTSAHEIGHMFTCLHCTHAQCVMNGSNNMLESDATPNSLCSECLKKMSLNLRFDNKKRLNQLKDFYQKHQLINDYKMVLKSLELINK